MPLWKYPNQSPAELELMSNSFNACWLVLHFVILKLLGTGAKKTCSLVAECYNISWGLQNVCTQQYLLHIFMTWDSFI